MENLKVADLLRQGAPIAARNSIDPHGAVFGITSR